MHRSRLTNRPWWAREQGLGDFEFHPLFRANLLHQLVHFMNEVQLFHSTETRPKINSIKKVTTDQMKICQSLMATCGEKTSSKI